MHQTFSIHWHRIMKILFKKKSQKNLKYQLSSIKRLLLEEIWIGLPV